MEIDPVALQNDIRERMRRYLLTTLPIHRRFTELRKQAETELSRSANLIRGPYLEALPDFPKGKSLDDLVEEGLLHEGFRKINDEVLQRPLHRHQEEAIRAILERKENVVVSTGTGSGKTECFLFPLANELLRAGIQGKPGIRAILVYPMNALANDQVYSRIIPLFVRELEEYGITVGRYTGQTKPEKNRKFFEELYRDNSYFQRLFGKKIPDNWLLSRNEMLDTPPHVLVTNYAMLEHLLLLPQNAPLFDGADLRYLVLDEVHTYAGAQATEVAMLLRKLRNRYAPKADIRCIGTSASLGTTAEAGEKVAAFATRLFGSPFTRMVTASREAHFRLREGSADATLSADEWIAAHEILQEVRHLSEESERRDRWNDGVVEKLGSDRLLVEKQDMPLATLLCRVLSRDTTLRKVSGILSHGLQDLRTLAQEIFPQEAPERALEALTALVALGAYARESANTFPLLPARYHIFTRGIEEATVELAHEDDCSEQARDLRLRREFEDPQTKAPRYRLMTCRKCGELYFEAYEKGHRIASEIPGKGWKRSVFWVCPKDEHLNAEDGSEEQVDERHQPQEFYIHLKTGELKSILDEADSPKNWMRTHRAEMTEPTHDEEEAATEESGPPPRRVTICRSCGSRDNEEIITAFHPGDHAFSATLCEVLFAHLPPAKDPEQRRNLPGEGRNLLVFSDNRQEAAFFAPYFQRTHEDMLVRRAIVEGLKDGEKIQIHYLAEELAKAKYRLRKALTNKDGKRVGNTDLPKVLSGKILSEFCSPGGTRVSLEDFFLVEVEYAGVDFEDLAERAQLPPDWGPTFLRWLLDSIRLQRAISMPKGMRSQDEHIWGNYAQDDRRFGFETTDIREARFSLHPKLREQTGKPHLNRYLEVLRDKLGREDWSSLLSRIWQVLTDEEEAILVTDIPGSPYRVLNHKLLSLRLRSPDKPVYRCRKCSKRSPYSIKGRCLQWRCSGQLEEVSPEEWIREMKRNHYHHLYTMTDAFPSLIAREHTAALSTELREDYENDFKKGEINVLSSSTTMEMGIDLGDLEGVFLRNVPPDIANYQQRAGRAGRRAQAAPASLTYSRNRRYDQDVFQNTEDFLRRAPRTPFVHLGNARLYRRHQFSVLLSGLLAGLGLDAPSLQIGQLFGLPQITSTREGGLGPAEGVPATFTEEEEQGFVKRVRDWVQSHESQHYRDLAINLLDALGAALTAEERATLEDVNSGLLAAFVEEMEQLAGVFGERFRHYKDKADELGKQGEYDPAGSLQNRAYRWANQRLVNFLSKHGIIPTYSFPVDSITLEVLTGKYDRSKEIELQRDARIGITEYAPGAEVIANGRVWTSRAIAQHPREFMPPFTYRVCEECRHIEVAITQDLLPQNCSCCNAPLRGLFRQFIEPKGFLTSVSESAGKEPGQSRATPPPALENQLIANAPDSLFTGTDLLRVDWAHQTARDGRMVIINRGRKDGFVKCGCGYAEAVTQTVTATQPHKNPFTGSDCTMRPSSWRFDMAHTFHTDVLQIRCSHPLPYPELKDGADPDEVRKARDGVARTIAEALRLAAWKRLDIPEGEISVTYRWLASGGVEAILFDNVPGGAGYTEQIRRENASDFFQTAIRDVLSCPEKCSRSCSKCLRSFSNQFHWDAFRRREALAWMIDIAGLPRSDARLVAGAEEVKLARVHKLCDEADEIVILRNRLGDFKGPLPCSPDDGRELPVTELFPEWTKRLAPWLAAGKTIVVRCPSYPPFKDPALPRARRLAEVLLPQIRAGVLRAEITPRATSPSEERLPSLVLFRKASDRAHLIYDEGSPGTILECLSSDNLLLREVSKGEAKQVLGEAASALEAAAFEPPESLRRFHFPPAADRTLDEAFRFLNGPSLKEIEIVDRYMVAMESNRQSFDAFMEEIARLCRSKPQTIVLRYGPARNHQEGVEWRGAIEQRLSRLKRDPRFADIEFRPRFRTGQTGMGDVHDRRVVARFAAPAAPPAQPPQEGTPLPQRRRRRNAAPAAAAQSLRTVTAEMTGGIDLLMDARKETTVYVFESPQRG